MSDAELVVPVAEQVELLMSGSEFGDLGLHAAMRARLTERLSEAAANHRPLQVYAGYDPSAPDLHLGHSITLRKLRQFQLFGHHVTVVIGTLTATVGDTSDRLSGRPTKTAEEVAEAARSYAEQCFTILDRQRTAVVANGEWLSDLRVPDLLGLASHFTVQQFLARDNYRLRIDRGDPVGLHEFLYALLVGYDALYLGCDVQLGATEQLFNILAGAKLQEAAGQPPSVALTFPILVGTDGTERMSKSRGNYVGLTEPPAEQYGKVMSIGDATMLQWVGLITDWSPADIEQFRDDVASGRLHPMVAKKRLAHRIVELFHGPAAAAEAQEGFERIHQHGLEPDSIPETVLAGPRTVTEVLVELRAAPSKSAARRLVTGGAVTINGEKVTSAEAIIDASATIKVGPRRFYRVRRG